MAEKRTSHQHATLAGGCFWCLEAVYQELIGVTAVIPGYTGGTVPSPTYQQVCSGKTGHTEAVQITFDPQIIRYRDLLDIFFSIHDPTSLNRQGNDIGTQYRSAIFYHDQAQQTTAQAIIDELTAGSIFDAPIVTELVPLTIFYPAEEYHREYFRRNPGEGYCRVVISPKLAKFRKKYPNRLNITLS